MKEIKNYEEESNLMTSDQFEMILKALRLVNANVKQDEVLKNIVDVAVNITNADRGTLFLVNKNKNEIWSKVLIADEIEEIRLKIGNGLSGWVAENGETLNINDVKIDERFDASFDEKTGYTTKNMLVYPIKNKNEDVVGVLQLLNSLKGKFSKNEEMFLNAISLNIAFALENTSLVNKLVETERESSIEKMGHFITYDLKKPILTCKRYADFLYQKELSPDAKQVVALLAEQLNQVSNQINSTSDYAEGTTLLRRQLLSLNDTINEFSIDLQKLLLSNNCTIKKEFSRDVNIYVDKKEIYQCFYNIVKNAVEACSEGSTILITSETKEDNVEIIISDSGCGINNSDLKNIFIPLWSKHKEKKSGLGLSISQKIIEEHEGSITINSEINFGTTVIIRLPIH